MRPSIRTPTDEPLPMSAAASGAFPGRPMRPSAVAEFDQLLHELNPDAARVSAQRLEGLCHWLASLPAATAREVLDRRLQRLEELRAMRDDPDWDLQAPTRQRLDKRSEEHTSELQSPCKLVCRLLHVKINGESVRHN